MAVEMKKYRLADIAEIVISSVDKKTKPGEKIVRLCNFTDVYHNWAIKQSDYDSFMVASASDSNINKLSLKKGFVAFTKDSETRDDSVFLLTLQMILKMSFLATIAPWRNQMKILCMASI